jgi:cytochrome bd-type quinol oxidase subunit 2
VDTPPVLAYRPASEDRGESHFGTVVAAVLTLAVVAAGVTLSVIAGYVQSKWWFWLIPVEVGAIICLAVWLRDTGRRRYAAGVWIGLGLAVLIEGACFARVQ